MVEIFEETRSVVHPTLSELNPDAVERALSEGWALPPSFYTDRRIYEMEVERLFRPSWVPVGFARSVGSVGDFFTTNVGGVPVVVVRDDSENLRAHLNICRHRGHPVMSGHGHCHTLQCPYHGWTYALSGALRGVPRSNELDIDVTQLGLQAAQVDVWAGIVFVSIAPEVDLHTWLGALPDIATPPGSTLGADANMVFDNRMTFTIRCNWKVARENALECYHCPTVHKTTFARAYDIRPDRYQIGSYDAGLYHVAYPRTDARSPQPPSQQCEPTRFYFLPPHSTIADDAANGTISLLQLLPQSADDCLLVRHQYRRSDLEAPPSSGQSYIATRATLEEDVAVCEAVQRNLRCGMNNWGRPMASSEEGIRSFHRLIWDAVGPVLRAEWVSSGA